MYCMRTIMCVFMLKCFQTDSTGEERELTLEAMQLNLLNMKVEVEQSSTRELQKVRTDNSIDYMNR
jgi:hypothetical protein